MKFTERYRGNSICCNYMMIGRALILLTFTAIAVLAESRDIRPVWPPAPDKARIEYLDEIDVTELSPSRGFIGKLIGLIGGESDKDQLKYPFDLVCSGSRIYMVCQNIPALVEVNRDNATFKLHECRERPFIYPVSLSEGPDGRIFVSDPEAAAIYAFHKGTVTPLITAGLTRPTGVAVLAEKRILIVVDTGDHDIKIFDLQGHLIRTVPDPASGESLFHFPTFAAAAGEEILINDALNYRIRRLNASGALVASFGREGDGPGCFGRPKGMAVDSDRHIYVVDNIFDNIQVFDPDGRLLLVIGTRGSEKGQFWSPGGIDIAGDTIFVADTFNHRVQILHYLGDGD